MTRVSGIMSKNAILFTSPGATARSAAESMKQFQRGCLVVISRGKLVGIITERDLVQRVLAARKNPDKTFVSQVMTKPVITVKPDIELSEAARIMVANRIRRLPVVDGSTVVGMLTVTDFARYLRVQSSGDMLLAAASRGTEYQTIFE